MLLSRTYSGVQWLGIVLSSSRSMVLGPAAGGAVGGGAGGPVGGRVGASPVAAGQPASGSE